MKTFAIAALALLFACSTAAQTPPPAAGTFDQCVASGGRLTRSYPAQCVNKDGSVTVQQIPDREHKREFCKNLCGNGTCEEITCSEIGCPCAESPASCPGDCSQP